MTFEQLRMADLVKKFDADMREVYNNKNLSVFQVASKKLQDVYNFYVTAKDDFKCVESYLKNLFSAFNYAAVIINDGLKNKGLDREAGVLLGQCIEIMQRSCSLIVSTLSEEN